MMISVIIPVGNDLKTLQRCLNSVVLQDAPAEIIVVFPKTAGTIPEICTDYVEKYRDIRMVEMNETMTIGTLTESAIGSHILFVDPADELKPQALRALYGYIETYDPDLVSFGFEEMLGRTSRIFVDRFSPGVYRSERIHSELLNRMVAYIDPEDREPYVGINSMIETKLFRKACLSEYLSEKYECGSPFAGCFVYPMLNALSSILIVENTLFRRYFTDLSGCFRREDPKDVAERLCRTMTNCPNALGQIELRRLMLFVELLFPDRNERISDRELLQHIKTVNAQYPEISPGTLKSLSRRYRGLLALLRGGKYRIAVFYFKQHFIKGTDSFREIRSE